MSKRDDLTPDLFFVYTAMLTPQQAVNLASKLLQFATKATGT